MKLAFIGLGKLGRIAASVLSQHHDLIGHDVSPTARDLARSDGTRVADDLKLAVQDAEVIFVAVQTPHDERYGGERPMPANTMGFDTAILEDAVAEIARLAAPSAVIAVISTVLPGTCRSQLLPLMRQRFVYNPYFIAMGTVARDMASPEFVLLGSDNLEAASLVASIYDPLHSKPRLTMSIESAELTKVTYNLWISAKLMLTNTVMELAYKTDANCDDVMAALRMATNRIVSTAYMQPGMGDGCNCHPRDAIAMAHLASQVGLSSDPFGFLVRSRENQTAWLASLVRDARQRTGLEVWIIGCACKPGYDSDAGSPALLLAHYLDSWNLPEPHFVDTAMGLHEPASWPRAIYVIGKYDPAYASFKPPAGSVVIDPWGIVAPVEGVDVQSIGRMT